MGYKSVRLGVCLLVLCGIAPVLVVRAQRQVATGEAALLFDGSRGGETIDGAFGSNAQRNRPGQGSDSRVSSETSYHGAQSFEGDARVGLAGSASKMEWSDSGDNIGERHYLSSINVAAANRTAGILCADYNLCIDSNPPAPRFGDWQGEIAPLDGSYLTTKQFDGSFGGVLLANAPASPNVRAGDLALIPVNPFFSNTLDSTSGSMNSAAAMQSSPARGNSAVVSVAATGAAIVSQAGNSRVLTSSLSSEDHSGQTDPGPSQGGIVASRQISSSSVRHTASSSSNSTGNDSGADGNGDMNQRPGSDNDWPVATFPSTPDVPWSSPSPQGFDASDPVYLSPVVSDDPVPGIDTPAPAIDPPAPVPEPSQITLMLTVIALVGLIAKRSAGKHGIARRAAV